MEQRKFWQYRNLLKMAHFPRYYAGDQIESTSFISITAWDDGIDPNVMEGLQMIYCQMRRRSRMRLPIDMYRTAQHEKKSENK